MFGAFLAFLAAILASAKDIYSKSLSSTITGNVSAFTSFAYALPFYVILLLILYLLGLENFELLEGFWIFVILRASTDSLAELCKMHALAHADLSVVSSILSFYLIFLLITSPLITGDIPSSSGLAGVVLCFLGSIAVAYNKKAPGITSQRKGVLYAIAGSLFFSLNACFDRLAVKSSSAAMSGFSMTLISCLILLPLIFFQKGAKKQIAGNNRALLIRGFYEVAFMVMKLWSVQYLQAPYVAGIARIALIFSIISGKIVFKEENFKLKLLGGILIILGSTMIILTGI